GRSAPAVPLQSRAADESRPLRVSTRNREPRSPQTRSVEATPVKSRYPIPRPPRLLHGWRHARTGFPALPDQHACLSPPRHIQPLSSRHAGTRRRRRIAEIPAGFRGQGCARHRRRCRQNRHLPGAVGAPLPGDRLFPRHGAPIRAGAARDSYRTGRHARSFVFRPGHVRFCARIEQRVRCRGPRRPPAHAARSAPDPASRRHPDVLRPQPRRPKALARSKAAFHAQSGDPGKTGRALVSGASQPCPPAAPPGGQPGLCDRQRRSARLRPVAVLHRSGSAAPATGGAGFRTAGNPGRARRTGAVRRTGRTQPVVAVRRPATSGILTRASIGKGSQNMNRTASSGDLVAHAATIAGEVAAKHADDVDRGARFPSETFAALRDARLLSAAVPTAFGGQGAGMLELGNQCAALAQGCSSSGMVLAMHHIQVACIARHGAHAPYFQNYLRENLVEKQELIASITSENGTFGDTRSSICAVEVDGDTMKLDKDATTVSYGAHADAQLVTCRRAADAAASDQVLALFPKGSYSLEQTGTWDTLGMRGTCSPGAKFSGRGKPEQIVPGSFADSSAQTMVPYSHILWSALWTGIATDALGRAATCVRG